ncbi:MAG: efflux RND transporter permease subunit, partial [Candidatus Muiribacteriota bacterium]
MSISQFAINKPVTVLMLVIGVIFVGYLALNGLGIDLFPDIDFPIAFIQAAYSGVDPAEMENIVTKPVEDEIATVSDIDRITSYSVEGFSQVVIQFKWGADIDVGAADLREKVDIVKRRLPSELDSIIVQKLDIDAQPVMAISIAGEMNLVELRSLVDNEIKPLIERASGVASASISGGLQREIHINVDLFKLEEYKIPIGDIISAISSDNRNIPA